MVTRRAVSLLLATATLLLCVVGCVGIPAVDERDLHGTWTAESTPGAVLILHDDGAAEIVGVPTFAFDYSAKFDDRLDEVVNATGSWTLVSAINADARQSVELELPAGAVASVNYFAELGLVSTSPPTLRLTMGDPDALERIDFVLSDR